MTSYHQSLYQPADEATQLLLVRHGQSAPYIPGQPFPTIDGHGDPALTEVGHHQAELVADRLAGEGVTAIYVSSLTRTHQTAAPLAARLGIEPTVEADLREIFMGEADGGRIRELMATGDPVALEVARTGEWGLLPGAETTAEFTDRCRRSVDRIVADHPGELVAAFCHGGVISALLAHAAQTTNRAFRAPRHTSINHLSITPPNAGPEDWMIRSFNDGAHSGHFTRDFGTDEPAEPRRISTQ